MTLSKRWMVGLGTACLLVVAGAALVLGPSAVASRTRKVSGTVADWPLRFTHHQFGVACFDTLGCDVRYNGFEFGTPAPTRSRSSFTAAHLDQILSASYGPVARSAPSPSIEWTCKDGTALKATVDIARIFKDGMIRHNVPRDEIAEGVSMGSTHILVEIDDRTVSVYTRTMIPLKTAPGAALGDSFRSELIKVHSQAY